MSGRFHFRDARRNAAIALSLVLLIGIVWGVTAERVAYERADARADAEKQNSNLSLALEEHTVRTLKGVEQALRYIRNEYRDDGARFDLRHLIAKAAIDDRLFHFIGMTDAAGNVVLGSSDFGAVNMSDRDYFTAHRKGMADEMFVGKPVTGRITGKAAIPMSLRIGTPDGSFGGVVYAAVDPHYFTSFYQQADIGREGLVTLVGLDGITRARRVGGEGTFGQDMSRSTLFAEQAKRTAGSFLSAGRLDGIRRFYSYRTLAAYPLVVAVATSERESLAEFEKRKGTYYVWASLATVVLLGAALGLAAALASQRRANREIAQNEARFRATFDQAAVGISLNAMDGTFLRVNQSYCSMLGYSEKELLARRFFDVVHTDDHSDGLKRLFADGESFLPPFENRHIRRDGTILWSLTAVSLVRDADGSASYLVAVVQDITERKRAGQELELKNTVLKTQQETSLDAILVVDENAKIVSYNRRFVDMWGIPETMVTAGDDEPVLRTVVEQMRDPEGFLARVRYLYEHRDEKSHEEIAAKDGRTIDRYSAPVIGRSGEYHGRIWYFRDITRRTHAEAALRETQENFQQLVDHIPEAFWITDVTEGRRNELVYLSPNYQKICGWHFESLPKAWKGWKQSIHPEDRVTALTAYRRMKDGRLDQQFRIVRPDGATRWVHVRGFPVRNPAGAVYRIAGTIEDVTERRLMEDRLVHQAHYDALTELPNRVLCFDRLKQAITQARRRNWLVSFLFLDLDRFKNVNDTLGHAVGDELLKQVAARLSLSVRTDDTVARLGGDEFAVILSDVARPQDAALIAQKAIENLAQPFQIEGHEIFVTASVGIASYPSDTDDPNALVKNADAAMFRAKLLGRNNYQFYTAALNERALEKLQLETQLRRALERKEFLLHYQPKVDLANGALTGFEALLRWKVPGNGLVSPGEFIPILEDSGLIIPVGEWVLNAACAQVRAWQDAGFSAVPVAVNLSAKQFQRQDICGMVTAALRRWNVEPEYLELEITESAAMQNPEETVAMLHALRRHRVLLSLDDFGTGYSSLAYLKRFPLDSLKIDRSFVTGLPDDADDSSIARAVIAMAHSLNMKVVGEGVETDGQRAFLAANGCDQMQGYLFSRPVPAEECTRFLQRPHGKPERTDMKSDTGEATAAVA